MFGRYTPPIGRSIGGLAAANALIRRELAVTVFEQAPQHGEVCAGVFIFPNSLRQLERSLHRMPLLCIGGAGLGKPLVRIKGAQ
jgi:salicylate hydroxylase